ncbi:MAG: endolytic transglycosylase MltG [Flavobacteriales bacterium]|nr:endolytic transglycosylase MltG [Flavobacteriales bacterium]
MKIFKILFFSVFSLIILFCAYAAYSLFASSIMEDTVFYIRTGTSNEQLNSMLKEKTKHNVLLPFFIYGIEKKYENPHAGKFSFSKGENNFNVLRRIYTQNGDEVSVTFNNIHNINELASAVSKQIEADSLSLISEILDTTFLNAQGFNAQTVRSFFIPNTYRFYWNTSAKEFVKRCVSEYSLFWNDERTAKAQQMNMSFVDISTLASIVQSETKKADEQSVVAGLYINRLNKNIRLQSDPTVVYAILEKNPERFPVFRVYLNDLKIDSPYNTYMYSGLPPAPILIPEVGALDAVLNYEKHKYLYMCADPQRPGYHAFAENLREHGINRRAYIKWVNSKEIK